MEGSENKQFGVGTSHEFVPHGDIAERLTHGKKLAGRLAIVPFLWLPLGAFVSLCKNGPVRYFFYFTLFYLVFTLLLYMILRRVIESKGSKPSIKRRFLCELATLLNSLVFVALYMYGIFTSWWSLFITIPVSLIIVFACVINYCKKC